MADSDFLPFADTATSNIYDQSTYAAIAARSGGVNIGISDEKLANKTWRQSAMGMVLLGQLIVDMVNADAVDDGTSVALLANLKLAIASLGGGKSVATVTGNTHTYAASDRANFILRSNSGAAMIDTLPGTGPGVLAALTTLTIHNADATAVMSVGVGAGATIDGVASGLCYLGPGQTLRVISDGTNYHTISKPDRCQLRSATTLYVTPSGSGGSNSNTGLTTASAFATLTFAYSFVVSTFDIPNGVEVTLQMTNGAHVPAAFSGSPTGGGSIAVVGNTGTPASVTISAVNASCFTMGTGASVSIKGGMTLTATGTSSGQGCAINQGSPGSVVGLSSLGGIVFGACGVAHIQTQVNSEVVLNGNYTISGAAPAHWLALNGGVISPAAAVVVTITGTPAFSQAFAVSSDGGHINAPQGTVTYSGAATGPRYFAAMNGTIDTVSGNANAVLPGNVNGSLLTGGQQN